MGTRAVIKYNGKLILATHWDGDMIGGELIKLRERSLYYVIQVAAGHHIDFAHKSIIKDAVKAQIAATPPGDLGAKNLVRQLQNIEAGNPFGGKYLMGASIQSADDFPISDISNYDDWAEYEYNVVGNKVYQTPLSGEYHKAKRGKTTLLNPSVEPSKPYHRAGWHQERKRHAIAARKGARTRLIGKSDTAIDRMRHAKHPGKRRSASGNTYFENRRNRADRGKYL